MPTISDPELFQIIRKSILKSLRSEGPYMTVWDCDSPYRHEHVSVDMDFNLTEMSAILSEKVTEYFKHKLKE